MPSSAHSNCNHPCIVDAPSKAHGMLNIKGNEHGINSGWFIWPYDFDPTWLLNCDGFKAKPEFDGGVITKQETLI